MSSRQTVYTVNTAGILCFCVIYKYTGSAYSYSHMSSYNDVYFYISDHILHILIHYVQKVITSKINKYTPLYLVHRFLKIKQILVLTSILFWGRAGGQFCLIILLEKPVQPR